MWRAVWPRALGRGGDGVVVGGDTEAFSSFAKRSKVHTEGAGEAGRELDELGHLCCDLSF